MNRARPSPGSPHSVAPGSAPTPRGRAIGRSLAAGFVSLFFASVVFGAALADDQVIVPKAAAEKSEPAAPSGASSGTLTFVAVLMLGCVGGWMLWRGRNGGLANLRSGLRAPRHLNVEETRSLGNRQYLVVASYRDKKFLLGVCQGRIDLLSSLNDANTASEEPRA